MQMLSLCTNSRALVNIETGATTEQLSLYQYRLAELLFERDSQIVTFEEIAANVYGCDAEQSAIKTEYASSIYNLIGRLRHNKISKVSQKQHLLTVGRAGFMLHRAGL